MKKIKKPNFERLDQCPAEYQGLPKLDEGESIFFARELEHIKAQTYDIKHPELKARQLFPVDFEANAGATTITYEQFDQVGIAIIVSDYSDELPRADLKGKEFTSKVRTIASSYGYNFDEIQSASMTGKSLPSRKAAAALRSHLVTENRIAWFGDAKHDIQGFLSNPNIQEVVLPADGVGALTNFSAKTADQIIRDITSLFTAVHEVSKGVEFADSLLMPINQYNLIINKRLPDSDTNVFDWVMGKNPFVQSIEWVNELKGAGAGGTDKMVAYRNSSDALSMEIPSEFKQLPVEPKGLEFVVPTHHRFGGILIYYPLSIAFADGI